MSGVSHRRPAIAICGRFQTFCHRHLDVRVNHRLSFVTDVNAHEPETIYVVPIKSDGEHFPPDGKLRVYRSRTGGNEWEALTKGLPQQDCYVNVLRDAMAIDSLDKCGVYFGTTGGQVYASADAGDSWAPIVRVLPAVQSSVEKGWQASGGVFSVHTRTSRRRRRVAVCENNHKSLI
jgi:hypothetical protein